MGTLSAPGQATLTSPGQATLTSPGQATLSSPGMGTLSAPGQATLTSPGQATLTSPGQATTTSPGQATLTSPGQATLTSPGQATTTSPGQATLTTPGQATTSSVGPAATSSQVVSSPITSSQVVSSPITSSQVVSSPITSSQVVTSPVTSTVKTTPIKSSVKTTPTTSTVSTNVKTTQVTRNIRTTKVSEIIITPYPHGPGFGIEVGGIDLGSLYTKLDSEIRLSEVTANALNGDLSTPNTSGAGDGTQGDNAGGQIGGSGGSSGPGSNGSGGGASSGVGGGTSSGSGSFSMGSNSSVGRIGIGSDSGGGSQGDFLNFSSDTKSIHGSSGSGSSHLGGINGRFSFDGGSLSATVGNMTGVDVNGFLKLGGINAGAKVGSIKGVEGNIGVNNDSLVDFGVNIGGIAGGRLEAGADINGLSGGISTGKISLADLRSKLKFGGANFGLSVGDISGLDLDASMNIGGFNMTANTGDISLGKLDLGKGIELPSFGFNLGGLFEGLFGGLTAKDGKSVSGITSKNTSSEAIFKESIGEKNKAAYAFSKKSSSSVWNSGAGSASGTGVPIAKGSGDEMTVNVEKDSGQDMATNAQYEINEYDMPGTNFSYNKWSEKDYWSSYKNTRVDGQNTDTGSASGAREKESGTRVGLNAIELINTGSMKTSYSKLKMPTGSGGFPKKTIEGNKADNLMAESGTGKKMASNVKTSSNKAVKEIAGNKSIKTKSSGQWAALVDSTRSVSRMHALRMDGINNQQSYAKDSTAVKSMNETLERVAKSVDTSAAKNADEKLKQCNEARKAYNKNPTPETKATMTSACSGS